jgi:hypothetical protein
MPYAELGWFRSGRGPYVVAGYVHESIDTTRVEGPQIKHTDGWEATIAYQATQDRHRAHPFVSTVIGHRYPRQCEGKGSDCSSFPRPIVYFFGLSFEVGIRR